MHLWQDSGTSHLSRHRSVINYTYTTFYQTTPSDFNIFSLSLILDDNKKNSPTSYCLIGKMLKVWLPIFTVAAIITFKTKPRVGQEIGQKQML